MVEETSASDTVGGEAVDEYEDVNSVADYLHVVVRFGS